jgi:hypothetical protein
VSGVERLNELGGVIAVRRILRCANCASECGAGAESNQFCLGTEDANIGLRIEHPGEKAGECVTERRDKVELGEHQFPKAISDGSVREPRGARFEITREAKVESEDQFFVGGEKLAGNWKRDARGFGGSGSQLRQRASVAKQRDGALEDALAAARQLDVHETTIP